MLAHKACKVQSVSVFKARRGQSVHKGLLAWPVLERKVLKELLAWPVLDHRVLKGLPAQPASQERKVPRAISVPLDYRVRRGWQAVEHKGHKATRERQVRKDFRVK